MTNKDLFYAMDGLDASFVMKAAPGEKLNKSNNAWLKWFSIAACFCLHFTTLFAFYNFLFVGRGHFRCY